MTPELASFSDWVLALLPRLFLFPGGLWMLLGLAVIRVASGGVEALRLQRWAADLARVNLGGAALAWAALSLLPMPGAAALPTPVDRWVLVALLAVSLLLELEGITGEGRRLRALAGAAITMVLLIPLVGAQGLLVNEGGLELGGVVIVGIFLVGLGIAALLWLGDKGMGSEVRGLAWASMSLAPVWSYLPDSWLTPTGAVFLLAGLVWRGSVRTAREIPAPIEQIRLAVTIQWLLALGALLAALLFAR